MRLWVDDQKDPMLAFMWDLPEGDWTWVKTLQEAREVLLDNEVEVLALDNDLGLESFGDGRELIHQMIQWMLDEGYSPPAKIKCISFNPVAETEINASIRDVEKLREYLKR